MKLKPGAEPLVHVVTLKLTKGQYAKHKACGGSKWLRGLIDAENVRITNVHKTELPNPRTNWWGGLT